jgi:GT2 family glycosyltransferase
MTSVDAVVLCWNRIVPTFETIDNLLGQKDVELTIWLVDQGSEPEAVIQLQKRAAQESRIRLIELANNVGVGGGRNIGMRAGLAEVIVCVDNDAVFASTHSLREVANQFDNQGKLGALGFRIENFQTNDLDLGSWVYPKALLRMSNQPFLATRFCGAGHAIRRSAFEKTSGYDESLFFYWEELDLSYQLIELGYEIGYEPNIVVRHKTSPEGRTEWRGLRFYYLVRNAIYLDWKYFRSLSRLVIRAGGYLLKGIYNGILSQALQGIQDSIRMAKRLNPTDQPRLSSESLTYIRNNDLKYRGGFWDRLQREVFVSLSNK